MTDKKELPWWVLPAAGAATGLTAGLVGGSLSEDTDWSPAIRAKKLLRCLVLGGVVGTGLEGVRQGFNIVADNDPTVGHIRTKMKEHRDAVLSTLGVKPASYIPDKKLLYTLLLKKAPIIKQSGYNNPLIKVADTNNSSYIPYAVGGGLGALGGLTLYSLLSEKKKRNLNGYMGSALAGTGIGLVGATLYSNAKNKKAKEEQEQRKREEEARAASSSTAKPETTVIEGKTVTYIPDQREFLDLYEIPVERFAGWGYTVGNTTRDAAGHKVAVTNPFVPPGYKPVTDTDGNVIAFRTLSQQELGEKLAGRTREQADEYYENMARWQSMLAGYNAANVMSHATRDGKHHTFKYSPADIALIRNILLRNTDDTGKPLTYEDRLSKLKIKYPALANFVETAAFLNRVNRGPWGMLSTYNFNDRTPRAMGYTARTTTSRYWTPEQRKMTSFKANLGLLNSERYLPNQISWYTDTDTLNSLILGYNRLQQKKDLPILILDAPTAPIESIIPRMRENWVDEDK